MALSTEEKKAATEKGNNEKDVEGELNEWKFRVPYRIHEENEGFYALYEANFHCGRVTYQLSREKPLDAKYCHCITCQTLHGKLTPPPATCRTLIKAASSRGSIPMGRDIPQRRY
jgi:hypothetical protein